MNPGKHPVGGVWNGGLQPGFTRQITLMRLRSDEKGAHTQDTVHLRLVQPRFTSQGQQGTFGGVMNCPTDLEL